MDSDDDYDMESGDYDLYSDDDDTNHYNNGDDYQDESEYGFVEEAVDDSATRSSQINYIALKEEDIRNQQKDDIQQLSIVLSITEVEASLLFLHYHWNLSKVNDEWFADEEKVRKTVGILTAGGSVSTRKPRSRKVRKVLCGICFDYCRGKDIVPIVCGHLFCSTCWNGYITTAINDGPGCLMLKCPQPSCSVAVGRDMIEKLVSEEDKDKYDRYFLRSYIEESRKMY